MLIAVLVILVPIVWAIITYNGFVTLRNRVDEAWSDIDVQLKRRHDLIPNLIEVVKGYAGHEERVFTQVTEARVKALGAATPQEKAQAENVLSGTLKSLFAVSENYPQLKASENFLKLQGDWTDTEDKIQASRRFYNGNVRDLNTKIDLFPDSIVANLFKVQKREFFEIEAGEKEAPKADFGKK